MISLPPSQPKLDKLDPAIQDYFVKLSSWLFDIYNLVKHHDAGDVKFTTSDAAPSGGSDGDVHYRVDGANTAIYLNKNGSWSAYTNP